MLDLHLCRFVSLIMNNFYSTSSTHNAVTKDTHPQMWHLMVTLSLPYKLLFSCIQHISYTAAMLCVKWQDPDGGHLVCIDGLPRWLRAGYAQANMYAHTHIHRWQPTKCGQEMDTLTIDLLRSMIFNLVIWQRGAAPTELAQWLGTLTHCYGYVARSLEWINLSCIQTILSNTHLNNLMFCAE